MNSFVRHIERQKFLKLAETAFTLMVQRGLNPIRFVEWYAYEGSLLAEHEIVDETDFWLRSEMRLVENDPYSAQHGPKQASPWLSGIGGFLKGMIPGAAAGGVTGAGLGSVVPGVGTGVGTVAGSVGGAVTGGAMGAKNAVQANQQATDQHNSSPENHPSVKQATFALDNFSKNMSQELASKPALTQSLHYLIATLRSNNLVPAASAAAPAAQIVQPAPGAVAPAVAPGTVPQQAWYNPAEEGGTFFTEVKMRKLCEGFVQQGVDPRAFVQWYREEGRHLPPHQFREGFGDWWNQFTSGLGSWWGGQGFTHGYNAERDRRHAQAAGQALHALQQLRTHAAQVGLGGPDFVKHIDIVLKELGHSQTAQQGAADAQKNPARPWRAGGSGRSEEDAHAVGR